MNKIFSKGKTLVKKDERAEKEISDKKKKALKKLSKEEKELV